MQLSKKRQKNLSALTDTKGPKTGKLTGMGIAADG
jgi:hypothetical protein